DDPALHQVLFEEAPRPPELLAELHALEDRAVAAVAAILAGLPGLRVGAEPGPAARPGLDTAARVTLVPAQPLVHPAGPTAPPAGGPQTVPRSGASWWAGPSAPCAPGRASPS